MIHLRLNWSTKVPARGPSKIPGNRVTNERVARTVEDLVVFVIHQITAKEANPLPRRDSAWVDQNLKNVNFHGFISYERVAGVLERRIETKVDWTTIAEIEILGLDEIALRKGQGNYVTLVTGQFRDGEIVILGVLPGHEKAVVVEYLRLIPRQNPASDPGGVL